MKKKILTMTVAIIACFSFTQVKAQTDVALLMRGGVTDANTLLNAYMSPLMKSFGAGLNAGWFQTAKPHGIGGFDVTISINPIMAPTSAQSFDVNNIGLKTLKLTNPAPTNIAPTIFGTSDASKIPSVEMHSTIPDAANPGQTKDTAMGFKLPPGLGVPYFAVPTAQVSVGVGFGTEVSIRYLPTMAAGDVKIGMFGFAVKHDIKQWIPGIKLMPFDLSAMFAYISMNATMNFGNNSLKPDTGANIYNAPTLPAFNNQKIEFDAKAWTVNVLVSKKLGPLTPYLGLGYQYSSVSFGLKGDYPLTVPNTVANATNSSDPSYKKAMVVTSYSNPINITGTNSGLRTTLGIRLKLLILTIHGDYTFAAYNTASVGVGLNVQSLFPPKL